ncbi:hypothetical protein GGD65_007321 [Bradyrhizobium sp. CIR18]|nr:hypothetical protein [Bradyrhizobium sp. CIR18]
MLLFPHLGRPDGPSDAAKRPEKLTARPDKETARLFSLAAHSKIGFLRPYFDAVGSG